jgi:F5/8 type C domain-containing protein
MKRKNLRRRLIGGLLAAVLVGVPAITPSPALAAGGTNLSLGKSVSASGSNAGFPASNVNDGNVASYWESPNNAFPQWVQIDLGGSVAIDQVKLKLPPDTAWGTRTQTLSVQGSTDGGAFTTLSAATGRTFNPATGNQVTVTFPSASVRYVRITVTANTGWPAGQVSTLEAYAG